MPKHQASTKTRIMTTLATVGMGLAVAGVGLLVVVYAPETLDLSDTRKVTADAVGAALIAIGMVQVIYDLWVRRAFLSEIHEVVGLKSSLAGAGIQRVRYSNDFASIENSLRNAKSRIDLVLPSFDLVYGRTVQTALARAEDQKCQIRVVVPDLDSEHQVSNAALQRRKVTEQQLKQRWKSSLENIESDPNDYALKSKGSSFAVYTSPYHLPQMICITESSVLVGVNPLMDVGTSSRYLFISLDPDGAYSVAVQRDVDAMCDGTEYFSSGVAAPAITPPVGTNSAGAQAGGRS